MRPDGSRRQDQHGHVHGAQQGLRAEGKTSLTPAQFFENANSPDEDPLFEGESIEQGDVVGIDTGLAQFFFYCAAPHDFRPALFDAKRVHKTAQDSKEAC